MKCPFCNTVIEPSVRECPSCKNQIPKPSGLSSTLRIIGWLNFIISFFGSFYFFGHITTSIMVPSNTYPYLGQMMEKTNYSMITYGIVAITSSLFILLIFLALAKIIDNQNSANSFLYAHRPANKTAEPLSGEKISN
jgi:hypothetical protein